MITVKKSEHESKVVVAREVLKQRAWYALCDLERGSDLRNVYKPLMICFCNLRSLQNYKTGEFQPEEYFNVLSSASETSIYSNINTTK